jgi:hypothetical protein
MGEHQFERKMVSLQSNICGLAHFIETNVLQATVLAVLERYLG